MKFYPHMKLIYETHKQCLKVVGRTQNFFQEHFSMMHVVFTSLNEVKPKQILK